MLLGPALIGSVAELIGLSCTLAALVPVLLLLAALSLPGSRESRSIVGGQAFARSRHDPAPEIVAV